MPKWGRTLNGKNKEEKIMKKKLLLFMAAVMALTSAGCGEKKANKPEATGELTVAVFDRGNVPEGEGPVDNNRWTQYINESFGKENGIDVKFYPIPRLQEAEKLNILMASKDAPDICFTYQTNVYHNFAKQNGLTDLTELIEEYGDNLKANFSDALPFGQYEGKQLSIPAKLALRNALFVSLIRQDWLDALNLPVPTTTEEFYNTMVQFKEKDPGNIGKENVVPFAMSAASFTDEDYQQNCDALLMSFTGGMTEEEYYTFPKLKYPGYKEGVRLLNKMYNEGLIDPDFALYNDFKTFEEKISSGKAGFYSYDTNKGMVSGGMYDSFKKNVPEGEFVPVDCFKNSEGKYVKRLSNPTAMYIFVPRFSKNAVSAVKYLNWMADYNVGMTLTNGNEGEHYNLVDGIPVPIDAEYNKKTRYNLTDYALIYNGAPYLNKDNVDIQIEKLYPDFAKIRKESMKLALTDTVEPPFFTVPIDSQSKSKANLDVKYKEAMIKSIVAKPDEFDSVYDSMVEEYMASGGEAVMQEKITAYNEHMKK